MVGLSRELRLLEEGARTATGYKSMRGSAWPRPNDRNRRPCSAQPVLSSVVPARPVSAIGLAALCGAPWRQPRNPPRNVGPKILVLGPKLLSKHRLHVGAREAVDIFSCVHAPPASARYSMLKPLAGSQPSNPLRSTGLCLPTRASGSTGGPAPAVSCRS
jgi:hypothetical protein